MIKSFCSAVAINKLFFAIAILVGCNSETARSTDAGSYRAFFSENTELRVPERYLMPNLPASMIASIEELDGVERGKSELLVNVPFEELGIHRPFERVSSSDIGVLVYLVPLSTKKSKSRFHPDAREAAQGLRYYQRRIIEHDKEAELYRVYPEIVYPKRWNYFKVSPEEKNFNLAHWVASCRVGPLENERKNLSNISCESSILYKDILVEFTIPGLHIVSVNILIEKLQEKISGWDIDPVK